MPNRLANENSPYLIQHAYNPVDWYPWGPEALNRARIEDKPIFLSIGYSACHWCHVMAHESFEDETTAHLMNEHFINIKVDREERPDLDNIYMTAVVAITGSGGWPMSVFLTPDGTPFYGGTYFPPVPRHNIPSFRDILTTIAHLWHEDRQRLTEPAGSLMHRLKQAGSRTSTFTELPKNFLDQVVFRLAQSYDWQDGGWGKAPKFPQPMIIEFLLMRAVYGDKIARDMACHALDAMSRGGLFDVIGGGFARYSTDDDWLVPHFEKMLYDNAQLALAYLHAYLITGSAHYRYVCMETLDFILRELTDDEGGFFSSLDADSDGEEGKYYLWSQAEIENILGNEEWLTQARLSMPPGLSPADLFCTAYGITSGGNFEGQNILSRKLSSRELANIFGLRKEHIEDALIQIRGRLHDIRMQRVRPALDDKVLVSWNALTIIVFAEAGRYLQRDDYLQAARKNANFILRQMRQDGSLRRSWRSGVAKYDAYLEDYSSLAYALLILYQADFDPLWYMEAKRLIHDMSQRFSDPAGGLFDTSDNHERLIFRPKDLQDNATPSGNAMAAVGLILFSLFSGESSHREMAEQMVLAVLGDVVRYPLGFGKWLHAINLTYNPSVEVALIGLTDDPTMQAFRSIMAERYLPNVIVAAAPTSDIPNSPALLHGRTTIGGRAAAYVCRNLSCDLPTTSPEILRSQLEKHISQQ